MRVESPGPVHPAPGVCLRGEFLALLDIEVADALSGDKVLLKSRG